MVTKAGSEYQAGAAGVVRRSIDDLDRPATPLFVALTIVLAWLCWFPISQAAYANFMQVCNHDGGAALRADEIIAMGQRPGVDFFYYYGPLPLLLSRAFFAIFGRSPFALFALVGLIGAGFAAGLARIVESFKPTRLGVLLVAVASVHTITVPVPTHALEAAILIWAVAMRIRGHRSAALALVSCGIFAKISMGTVLLAGLIALTAFDAIRERSTRPLRSLLAIPCTVLVLLIACSIALGYASVVACFDPRLGEALYSVGDMGFLREGKNFWHPAGHTLGWYLGGMPGPWLVASTLLLVLTPMAVVRLVRGTLQGTPRDAKAKCDETYAIACIANLAFVTAFFGPSMNVCYYSWLPLVGVTPLLARARYGSARSSPRYSWLALSAFLLLSTKAAVAQGVSVLRQPRVWVGKVSMPADERAELKESLSLAHATGRGVVAVVARAANFGLVDPTLRQGRYWMMQVGMRATPSIAELLNLAHSSDAIFVSQFDYPGLLRIPDFQPLLTRSERIHEGKYFLVLRPPTAAPPPR